jgi:hypothetical protein
MIAATFGHESAPEGYVTVNASDEARRIIRQVVSISMFVRTRKPDGVLFHLGAVDSDTVSKFRVKNVSDTVKKAVYKNLILLLAISKLNYTTP